VKTDPRFWFAEIRGSDLWYLMDDYYDEQGPYATFEDLWSAWRHAIDNWEPTAHGDQT